MGSVLIKGMDMPQNCAECVFCNQLGLIACDRLRRFLDRDTYYKQREDDCPVLPLPENYGNLIDVDRFRADYNMAEDCAGCASYKNYSCDGGYDRYTKMDFCEMLDTAEIVVPK